MKKAVSTFLLCLWATAACAAPNAPAGYDPTADDIPIPDEREYMQQQQEDMAAMDAQYKALQESAEETARIREWEKMDTELRLRQYDELVFKYRKDFDEAKKATNPFIGEQGYVVYPYAEVIPIIRCRPMSVTDIALQPGESIMGIHAGDTIRWLFSPSQSMKDGQPVSHIVVKPSKPGISTNLLIHTDRRTYNMDLTASEKEQYIRGVAFSYPINDLTPLFTKNQRKKDMDAIPREDHLEIDLDGFYTRYKIVDKQKADWRPDAVFDDGVKTYIKMPVRFSETPAFYILLDRKETLVNYRVKGRYYVVDRLFDRAYLKVGSKKVVIIREDTLSDSNIRESRGTTPKRDSK